MKQLSKKHTYIAFETLFQSILKNFHNENHLGLGFRFPTLNFKVV